MADLNVAETIVHFGYAEAKEAMRQTEQAMAIMRVVSIAVDAQEDGSISYDDNEITRWGPAIGDACSRVHQVRDSLVNTVKTPSVDWWTPLAILEATDAAIWHTNGRTGDERLSAVEVKRIADVAIRSLMQMHKELSSAATELPSKIETA